MIQIKGAGKRNNPLSENLAGVYLMAICAFPVLPLF
jgi:hypothetical protein